jgi:hypothetical protein
LIASSPAADKRGMWTIPCAALEFRGSEPCPDDVWRAPSEEEENPSTMGTIEAALLTLYRQFVLLICTHLLLLLLSPPYFEFPRFCGSGIGCVDARLLTGSYRLWCQVRVEQYPGQSGPRKVVGRTLLYLSS